MNPIVTVVLPIYNEENNVLDCLNSIVSQNIPTRFIEILVIDDDSTDHSVDMAQGMAEQVSLKILRNGKKDYDIGKAIGINHAKGEFILFIDADNRLLDPDWLTKSIDILKTYPDVIGVQSWKFEYSSQDEPANRYTSLIGNTDPVVYYLKHQDHLGYFKKDWDLRGVIKKETDDYIIIDFHNDEIPTLGSQGFLTRKEYFDPPVHPFQHIEFCIDLLHRQDAAFGFMKNTIEHKGVFTFTELIKKLSRNMDLYLKDTKVAKQKRYSLNIFRIIKILIITQTFVLPLYDSTRGFAVKRDYIWFMHVLLSFIMPWIYASRIARLCIVEIHLFIKQSLPGK